MPGYRLTISDSASAAARLDRGAALLIVGVDLHGLPNGVRVVGVAAVRMYRQRYKILPTGVSPSSATKVPAVTTSTLYRSA